jgi:cholestenol delta-isomerase
MASHPYYPKGLNIPGGFLPQSVPMEKILFWFFSAILAISISFVYLYTRPSKTARAPLLVALWFLACGFIHTFVEGYFVVTHATLARDDTFLANLWKEYGKSDSRYLVSDPTVLFIEGITAVL